MVERAVRCGAALVVASNADEQWMMRCGEAVDVLDVTHNRCVP